MKSITARDQLLAMMNEFALIDIFKERNLHKKSYTYESKALKLSSRIDFFLIAQHLTKWVERIETKVSNAPDHRAVRLTLLIAQVSRGPGLWKFNNSLLEDGKYVDLIRENYTVISERYASLEDKKLKWELIKMELRGLTIPYAKNKAKKGRIKETNIQKRMEELDSLMSNLANMDYISHQLKAEYTTLKEDLCLIYENKAKGAIIRSKTKWIEQGEKPTKYFFDGFTWEFYNCFFDLLGRDLVDSFNSAYNTGERSISQRRGVITLVPKEDSDLELLNNWRTITLLNLDYKIASKIIARRIEKVLPVLICSDQSGFVKGRYMGQNIRLINDILKQTKLQDIPGILLQLDFQKAFDTIEWKFIQNAIAFFNFGKSIQRWISTFYTNIQNSVLNNGFSTDYFALSKGS